MAKKKTGERERQPRFYEWVRAYGISKLTRDLGKNRDNRSVVQAWLARKQRPNGKAAVQLISLSTQHPLGGKPLTFEDIYGYFVADPSSPLPPSLTRTSAGLAQAAQA
jgi:hypothetical protein